MREILLVRMKKEASSELLAGLCRTAAMGFQGCCPFPRCECPIIGTRCEDVTPELWDEVLHRPTRKENADAEEEDHAED